MKKLNKLQMNGIHNALRGQGDLSEYCSVCGSETNISDLHLPTLTCSSCFRPRIVLDKKTLEMVEKLNREILNEIKSKKLQKRK